MGQGFKYGKTFLMQIADLKLVDPCEQIYETYCSNKKTEVELSMFYSECKKIENEGEPTPEEVERAEELLRVAKDHEKKLVNLVKQCQANFQLLQVSCQKEFEKLPESLKEQVSKTGKE